MTWPADTAPVQKVLDQIATVAAQTDTDRTFPEESFSWLDEAGLLSITLPDQALDSRKPVTDQLLRLLKRIGAANLSVGRVYEGHINALNLIQVFC